MPDALRIVLPIFALIAIGYVFGRRRLIPEEGVTGLVNIVFFLAIPAVLFRTLAQGNVGAHFEGGLLEAYYAAALFQFGLGWLVSRFAFGNRGDVPALGAMGATFSNVVLMCIPLVQRAYGDAGMIPLMLIVMVHSGILFLATTIGIEFGRGAGAGWLKTLAGTLKAVILNPIVLACASGLLYGLFGPPLPDVVDDVLAFIGRAASPLSLLAVGVTLSTCRLRGDLREIFTVSAMKILLLPTLVYLSATYLFGIRPEWVTIAVLAAAMPAGANVYVFARRYGVYVERATGLVLVTTLASVVTLTLLIAILPPP